MLNLDQTIRLHPQVVDTDLEEGEVVLLHLHSATYFSLNLTGSHIWHDLKQGCTLRESSQHLQEEFEVEAEQAEQSVLRLVEELLEQELVELVR